MQKTIKWVFLFLLIALPVAIYFFLQAFGENKFAIPILYMNGIENRADGCPEVLDQYYVPRLTDYDTTLEGTSSEIVIYNLGRVKESDQLLKSNNLVMLNEKMNIWPRVGFFDANEKSEWLFNFAKCGLNLEVSFSDDSLLLNDNLVLIDSERKIRGYYNVLERQEIDRMITEIEILLKE